MKKIEVAILDTHLDPGGTMMFMAKLTQRGHNIKCMEDLFKLKESSEYPKAETVKRVAALPHGTIKRFCPITVAIVGASRRFLAQARTHQVGFTYVSASLQYSDYSGSSDFVVPYSIMEADARETNIHAELGTLGAVNKNSLTELYLSSCNEAMNNYRIIAQETDNDTAGYAAPQGLRNILIMQGNHEAWMHFIRLRSCNRNTNETQYVTMRIWEELLKTENGDDFFRYAGPDCMFGACREGKMCCGKPLKSLEREARALGIATPRHIINTQWPLLQEVPK